VWLDETTSLYDRFGTGYTLLVTGNPGVVDTSVFEVAARERGIPMAILAPHHAGLRDLYEAELVLIRPDQHVAWRGNALPVDAGEVLDVVRGADATETITV